MHGDLMGKVGVACDLCWRNLGMVKANKIKAGHRIATAGMSWTRIVGHPALGISSATFKNYANKAIQVGVESRMKEYGYSTAVEIALDVAG